MIPPINVTLNFKIMDNLTLEVKKLKNGFQYTVKEGYLKSIEILKGKQTDITKAGLEELKTVQGRAIAALAIDYLVGECTQFVLLGVPIKDR